MPEHEVERASTTEGLPIAPSMAPGLASINAPKQETTLPNRVFVISGLASLLAIAAAIVAQALARLIGLITNLAYYGRVSTEFSSPRDNHLGLWAIAVPVLGGIVVGFMARYGSKAIRGHGIPEAMEQVLLNKSRIPARMTFLKPISAAIAIGTGGPFGAEGPIIATGGAMGSLLGQWVRVTDEERKTLLAAGAAAGMSATFGTPVSAVLLAVELLLFEFRPRSVIPVALASAVATATRWTFDGAHAVFPMKDVLAPNFGALWGYIAIGAVIGVLSVGVTRAVYWIEDMFEKLPLHWMWWPALGGIAVGVVGIFSPSTLGVGYDNIDGILNGHMLGAALALFCLMKFISWSIALGSGTSGGTLAPLLTIGGGAGALLGTGLHLVFPNAAIDPRVAALVGMAALFGGASRAMMASVVFAFEATLQPLSLLPLLAGCAASFLVSARLMRHSIMTEKIARRGVRVPSEYAADFLDRVLVRDVVPTGGQMITLRADQTIGEVKQWILSRAPGSTHQGFPVLDASGHAIGVLTRRNLLEPDAPETATLQSQVKRTPLVVYPDNSLREAADHMVREGVGRLVVVDRADPLKPIGMVTRSDLLNANLHRIKADTESTGRIPLPSRSLIRRRTS